MTFDPTRDSRCLPRATVVALALLVLAACDAEVAPNIARGRGLSSAGLSPDARAGVYAAALESSFDTSDPSLTVLLDPRLLPRESGYAGGSRQSASATKVLIDRGIVRGTCAPPLDDTRHTPRCAARGPGYVARFSDVYRRSADTVEVYLAVTRYDTERSGSSENLRFERAYQVVRRGDRWSAVAEGRVTAPRAAPPP